MRKNDGLNCPAFRPIKSLKKCPHCGGTGDCGCEACGGSDPEGTFRDDFDSGRQEHLGTCTVCNGNGLIPNTRHPAPLMEVLVDETGDEMGVVVTQPLRRSRRKPVLNRKGYPETERGFTI